jgi:hypothetical protein
MSPSPGACRPIVVRLPRSWSRQCLRDWPGADPAGWSSLVVGKDQQLFVVDLRMVASPVVSCSPPARVRGGRRTRRPAALRAEVPLPPPQTLCDLSILTGHLDTIHIQVHLTRELRLEGPDLQVDDHEAAGRVMVEEQIEYELLPADLQ